MGYYSKNEADVALFEKEYVSDWKLCQINRY